MQASFSQLVQLALISGGFALCGGLLGAIIVGAYNLRAKRNEYVNDYYKKVIDRRVAAYEQLESLIVSLRTAVLGDDGKPYHDLFSQADLLPAYQMLRNIASQALWLSDDAFDKARELNQLLWRCKSNGGDPIDFGKQHYETLTQVRENLEKILSNDLLSLHNVEQFLRQKKKRPDPGLQPWH